MPLVGKQMLITLNSNIPFKQEGYFVFISWIFWQNYAKITLEFGDKKAKCMIIFTSHSEEKLNERKITRLQVIEALKKPDKIIRTYGNRVAAFKKLGKLYLKVIYRHEGKDLIIITQHWVEKFNQ
jgi:Domain of unknown function (DUF4258)